MPLTLGTYDAVLKDKYEGFIMNQLNEETPVLKIFTTSADKFSYEGRQIIKVIRTGRNEGVGGAQENRNLPTAQFQRTTLLKIPVKYNYGRIELTTQTIKASRSDKGAFARAIKTEIDGLITDLSFDRDRQLCLDGRGILGQISSISGTTITVKKPGNVAGTTNTNRYFNQNMLVGVITAAGPDEPTRMGNIDAETNLTFRGVFTVNAPVTGGTTISADVVPALSAAEDYLVRAHATGVTSVDDTALNNEVMGLNGLIDSSSNLKVLHGIDRTAVPQFQSFVLSSVGALSADILQQMIDASHEISGKTIDCLLSHYSVRRSYLSLLEPFRRFTTDAQLKRPDAGVQGAALGEGNELRFSDIPWKVATHASYGTIYGLHTPVLARYIEVEGEWGDEDGAILSRVANKDAYEAFFRVFDNVSQDQGNCHFRADGVTATVRNLHTW